MSKILFKPNLKIRTYKTLEPSQYEHVSACTTWGILDSQKPDNGIIDLKLCNYMLKMIQCIKENSSYEQRLSLF